MILTDSLNNLSRVLMCQWKLRWESEEKLFWANILHYITLHYNTLHYITLRYIILYYINLRCHFF